MKKRVKQSDRSPHSITGYDSVLSGIVRLLEGSRRASARTVNAIMTATYWEMGRRIVEFEQGGSLRAEYGERLMEKLSADLTARFGRGFGLIQVRIMRQFFLAYPAIRQSAIDELSIAVRPAGIPELPSGTPEATSPTTGIAEPQIVKSRPMPKAAEIRQSPIDESSARSGSVLDDLQRLANRFPLSWTHYTRLLRVDNPPAREFYQTEALRGGWSVRQLERQIGSQFYERTALSRKKVAMLRKGQKPRPGDAVTTEEEIRNPLVLEFLGLRDEYSETDLEAALIRHPLPEHLRPPVQGFPRGGRRGLQTLDAVRAGPHRGDRRYAQDRTALEWLPGNGYGCGPRRLTPG